MYDFGDLLKCLRTKRGYTQAQIAEKLNKSKSAISKYENNQKLPTLKTMIDISRLFNVSLDTLAGIEKKETITLDGLTLKQLDIINTLLIEFRSKENLTHANLTNRQCDIIANLVAEFLRQ